MNEFESCTVHLGITAHEISWPVPHQNLQSWERSQNSFFSQPAGIIVLIFLKNVFIFQDPFFDPTSGQVPLPPARRAAGDSGKANRASQDYDQLPSSSGELAENSNNIVLCFYSAFSL